MCHRCLHILSKSGLFEHRLHLKPSSRHKPIRTFITPQNAQIYPAWLRHSDGTTSVIGLSCSTSLTLTRSFPLLGSRRSQVSWVFRLRLRGKFVPLCYKSTLGSHPSCFSCSANISDQPFPTCSIHNYSIVSIPDQRPKPILHPSPPSWLPGTLRETTSCSCFL